MGYLGPSPIDLLVAYSFCYGLLGIAFLIRRYLYSYSPIFSWPYYIGWFFSLLGNLLSLAFVLFIFFERQGNKFEPAFGHVLHIVAYALLSFMTVSSLSQLIKDIKTNRVIIALFSLAFLVASITLYFLTDSHYRPYGRIPLTDLLYANVVCLGCFWGVARLCKIIPPLFFTGR